ncbi:MAG: SIMPL domain-containing protein [Ignavibacteriae bacterium]|nr:SIMPL domain-containing protein [Ignavibacteriota bacterium]
MQTLSRAIGVLMMIPVLAFSQQPEAKEKMRTVNVRGEGMIAVSPDQVRLSVQVNTQAQTASAAMRSASGKTQEILSLLKSMGVEEKNIQTSRVNVSPTYDYSKQIQPPPIVGYHASNELSILFKAKLMEKVGEFMDKAVTAGATNFGALQYEASRHRELEREALTKAAADARARAEVLAKELGATVGQVHTISESVSSGGPAPIMRTMAMDASAAAPVMSGELTIRADVNVVFELK